MKSLGDHWSFLEEELEKFQKIVAELEAIGMKTTTAVGMKATTAIGMKATTSIGMKTKLVSRLLEAVQYHLRNYDF